MMQWIRRPRSPVPPRQASGVQGGRRSGDVSRTSRRIDIDGDTIHFWTDRQGGSSVLLGRDPRGRWLVVQDPVRSPLERISDGDLVRLWQERQRAGRILEQWSVGWS